jgi:hypothetical protein
MIGFLLYLCASRLDIVLFVCMCARFQTNPKEVHLRVVKRIMQYLVYTSLGFGTIGTLNQGYPLLQRKGIAPMRRLLAAWRTASNSTGWAGQRAPRGEERHHASVRPDPHRGSPGPYIHTGPEPQGRSEPRQGSGTRRTLGYAGVRC